MQFANFPASAHSLVHIFPLVYRWMLLQPVRVGGVVWCNRQRTDVDKCSELHRQNRKVDEQKFRALVDARQERFSSLYTRSPASDHPLVGGLTGRQLKVLFPPFCTIRTCVSPCLPAT